MNKKITTLFAAALFAVNVFAQAPEKMSYQAVVRDATNSLIMSSSVGMQISILKDSPNGNPVYTETQTPMV